MTRLTELREISEDTALFPWNAATPHRALESTIAIVLALAAGECTGHRAAAAIAAGAAFTVGFAVFHAAMSSTLLSMGLVTLGIASATLAGSLASAWGWAVLLVTLLAALNYGLLASLSPNGSWIGQQCAVFVIVNAYFAKGGLHYAAGRAAMVLAGGGLQMLVFFLVSTLRLHKGPQEMPPLVRQVQTRTVQLWRGVREELHWDRESTGYELRLMLTVLLSTAIYRRLHVRNGYWAPMTALLVLKPQWAGTLSRGVARVTGTTAAAVIALLLSRFFPPLSHLTYFALIVMYAWACYAVQAVNYALFSMVLTMYVVHLFAFGGFSERSAAGIRLLNTALGGLLALGVDFVWRQIEDRRGMARRKRFVAEPGKPAVPIAPRVGDASAAQN